MKHLAPCFLFFSLVLGAMGQSAVPPAESSHRATIAGIVTKDPGAEPVKKAVIEVIAENQQQGGDYTAVSAPDGTFRIEGILPGRYHMFVERTGLLEADKRHANAQGRILTLSAGQELKDLQIRLQAAAVVRGRVTDEDGDPMAEAQVSVLRQTYGTGRSRWEPAGSERTNDLGEYRIAGLAAGSYYVSVNPPPDFKSLIESDGHADAASASEKPAMSYQTSYYPGTADRGQASPIQLHAGDDFPVNFSLVPSPTLHVRGAVVNLPPRSSATIMLQSREFNVVLNGAEIHKDGSFVIHDVAPGSYTILATVENAPVQMMARQTLQVANNVEGVRLAPLPGASVRGRMRVEGKGVTGRVDLGQMFLSLHPSDGDDESASMFTIGGGFSYLAHVGADGTFEWKNVPPGSYNVRLGDTGAQTDWFLKAVQAGGRDASEGRLTVNGGPLTLDIVASADGAQIEGVVVDSKGEPVADAVVVVAPDRLARGDLFQKTVSDQRGRFTIRGISPGKYSLFAWEAVEGEAYYNPDFLKSFEGHATSLQMNEGEHRSLQVEVIAAPQD
ncbi:MAG TPA: carboxypeptidase-like regulatory domain-containing protein [Candidatus Sulfotelmatobacter sp.]|nr:carboxypeptidase-like regulatory domain-containing protein [Candidatus Sulfotelmatobacter sp.]